ncbi:MAG: excinuclease ABC subunit UvrC, partial [Chloroflexi bacterium]|nr:excinuclease ABC subunit UvrC [Chloroflexota bacterium]
LKDDKRYPYIKISMGEDFPRVLIVRNMVRDGARYFGPFTSSQAVRQSLDLLRRLFPYRSCDREITGQDRRPCLYYHIKRCVGPCIGAIDQAGYRAVLERAALFLEGKQEEIVDRLESDMQRAAEELRFEKAAELRDQVSAITQIIEKQRIVSARLRDHDLIAMAREDGQACVQVFFIRGGKLIGREYFVLTGTQDEPSEEVMGSFVKQFYDEAANVPPEILVQNNIDELMVIQEWLHRKRGTKVEIKVPRRGEKRELMRMAVENASDTLSRLRAEWEADSSKHVEALSELQSALELPAPPARIECYDISNIQGTFTVGSMVVFVQGVPSKQDYRRFRVRSVQGSDDFASMGEVLYRRFRHAQEQMNAEDAATSGNRWAIRPDLVIVDGGLGQLNVALETLDALGVGDIPVVGLAKQHEELYIPGRDTPLCLPSDSQGLYLLQRIRDEAHRFAIEYHRKLRDAQSTRSLLDEIPGIGPKRRQALLTHFGSLDAIRQATVDELAAVEGMTRVAAEQLSQYL